MKHFQGYHLGFAVQPFFGPLILLNQLLKHIFSIKEKDNRTIVYSIISLAWFSIIQSIMYKSRLCKAFDYFYMEEYSKHLRRRKGKHSKFSVTTETHTGELKYESSNYRE